MDDATLSKMKVADLKKELKNRSLATTGNKTELVERLQVAINAGDNGNLGETGGGEEDFDEEEILGGEEEEEILGGDGEEGMEEELTPQEEEAALGGIKLKDTTSLLETTQPEPEKKKISLKRSEPSLPAAPISPKSPTFNPEEGPEEEEGKKEEAEGEKGEKESSEGEPTRKLIKVDSGTAEKSSLEVRAQRFGVPLTDTARIQARAARFGATATNGATTANKPAKLSMETGGLDVDRLKARAERFGEVTSKSLVKLSEQEKMKKRSARFSGSSDSEDKTKAEGNALITSLDTKLATRAEKFGSAATKDQDDAMKKRAERFGIK